MTETEEKLLTMAVMIGFRFEDDPECGLACYSPNGGSFRWCDRDYAPIYVADHVHLSDLPTYEFLKPWLRAAATTNPSVARCYAKAKTAARIWRGEAKKAGVQ